MIRGILFLAVVAVVWYLVRAAIAHNRRVSSAEKANLEERERNRPHPADSGRKETSGEEVREARFRDL